MSTLSVQTQCTTIKGCWGPCKHTAHCNDASSFREHPLARQVSQTQMDAHFHVVHLIAVMAKLLPEWLPEQLFSALHRQWNSPERRAR